MHSSVVIGAGDYIVGGINGGPTHGGRGGGASEIYSLLTQRGITTLVYFGARVLPRQPPPSLSTHRKIHPSINRYTFIF